jgi:preprotein translocase subunit SecB
MSNLFFGDAAPKPTSPAAEPSVNLLFQCIKDMSIENPSPFDLIGGDTPPDTQVEVDVQPRGSKDGENFEVLIIVRVEMQRETKKLFVLELQYAGFFQIENASEEMLPLFLLVQCPTMLWPDIQHNVAKMTMESGLTALRLGRMNFMDLLKQKIEAQEATGA